MIRVTLLSAFSFLLCQLLNINIVYPDDVAFVTRINQKILVHCMPWFEGNTQTGQWGWQRIAMDGRSIEKN